MRRKMKAICNQTLQLPLGTGAPNLGIFGPSGSGKTQNFMLPSIDAALRADASVVVVNTKGKRMTRIIRSLAMRYGRSVQVLAPRSPERSVGWNEMASIRNPGDARDIAKALMWSAEIRENSQDSLFFIECCTEWTQTYMQAAMAGDFPEEKNLAHMRRIISAGAYAEFADRHTDYPGLSKHARFDSNGGSNGATTGADLGQRTAWLDDPSVRAVVANDELKLMSFAQGEGDVLILEIDEQDVDVLRPFSALFIHRILAALLRTAAASPGGRLPKKTIIFINEFPSCGRIDGIFRFLHTCRERGVSVVADAQSISQFSIYGSQADTVLAGFQSCIILPGADQPTAEYFSRKAGTMTIQVETVNENWDAEMEAAQPVGRSLNYHARPVLLPSEIARPSRHPLLGMPATFFLGDGTPVFQAYTTPAHRIGWLEAAVEAADTSDDKDDQRESPLTYEEHPLPTTGGAQQPELPPDITNTSGWASEKLKAALSAIKREHLGFATASSEARRFWTAFENENRDDRLSLVLRLAEELRNRKPPALLEEFFAAYKQSRSDNIQAVLHLMDYLRFIDSQTSSINAPIPSPRPHISIADSRDFMFARCLRCRTLNLKSARKCRNCSHPLT